MIDPYKVVREFEKSIADYAGSSYAISVDSCTNALFLCCKYLQVKQVTIPKKTYVSVPGSIIHAGGNVSFVDIPWEKSYQLSPYPIYDSARYMSRSMYESGTFQCISFSANKPISIGKGGMILTDNEHAAQWFKVARYMGRHECAAEDDTFEMIGWNMYLTPEQAARGLLLASFLKDENYSPKPDYQDLSKYSMFCGCKESCRTN